MNFEIAAQGMGAKYVLDGTDTCAAMFNPEGDMGDVEMWELIWPMIYLSRRHQGEHGRRRAPPRRLELRVAARGPRTPRSGSSRTSAPTRILGLGAVRRLSGLGAYVHNIKGADLVERAQRGEAYPVADGELRRPGADGDRGRAQLKQDNFTTLEPFAEGDLYLSVMKGGAGLGDPLLRPVEAVERDVRRGPPAARASPSRSTACRTATPTAAGASSGAGPRGEWWAAERASGCLPQDFIDAVKVGYAESMRLSRRFAAEFRGFWDLPEDFEFDVETPTVPAAVTEKPGQDHAGGVSRRVPGRLGGGRVEHADGRRRRRSTARRSRRCSTRSSPGARSRTSSPATRTPTGSRSGSRCSRSGSPTTIRSCCRCGEGLNVVRSPDGRW